MAMGWAVGAAVAVASLENIRYVACNRISMAWTDPGVAFVLPPPRIIPAECHCCGGPTRLARAGACWYCQRPV